MFRKFILLVLLSLTCLAGCARQPQAAPNGGVPNPSTIEGDQKLPFGRPPSSQNVLMPSAALVPAIRSVPAGVPIVVRLRSTISSATARSGDQFAAVLDQPVLVDGETV